MKTETFTKFRKPRLVRKSIPFLAAIAISALGLSACSGRESGSERVPSTTGSTPQGNVFQAPPTEAGQEVPEGLADEADQTLIALLQSDPNYSSYVSLLQLSDVSRVLATTDSVTVFAPVNEAIRAQSRLVDRYLAPGDLDSTLRDLDRGKLPELDDPEGLAALLERGITSGELTPEALKAGLKLGPLEGDPIRVTGSGEDYRVAGVRFDSKSGSFASNGILYPAAGLVRP